MSERDLRPETPAEAGVDEKTPDESRVEGAHVLASQARPRLSRQGFDEDEVIRWAETFIAEQGTGDVDAFLTWLARKEDSRA